MPAFSGGKGKQMTEIKIDKIDKDVPMPRRCFMYPFGELCIGDSFFVAGGRHNTVGNASIGYATRHLGVKFTTRQVTEGGIAGVRCWRIA